MLLLNLGGPDTLADVQPFLYNLFVDDSIIRLPPYGARPRPPAPAAPAAATRAPARSRRAQGGM